jgi:hypothetical protein
MAEILPVAILKAVVTHAKKLGVFDSVSPWELTSGIALGGTLHLGVWGGPIRPVTPSSGLASLSWRVQIDTRIYTDARAKPLERVEPRIYHATSVFLSSLAGDFQVGGGVRNIDFFGQTGDGMAGTPGYATIDNKQYRIMDIAIPLIINDVMALEA